MIIKYNNCLVIYYNMDVVDPGSGYLFSLTESMIHDLRKEIPWGIIRHDFNYISIFIYYFNHQQKVICITVSNINMIISPLLKHNENKAIYLSNDRRLKFIKCLNKTIYTYYENQI